MFGFFTTQVTKGELRSNLTYLQNLQKKGKEVRENKRLNLGSNVTVYREITEKYRNAIKGDVIGFEESVVKGSIEMKPYKGTWETQISFPETPFLEKFNYKTDKYNYPKKWCIPSGKNTTFTFRHITVQIHESKYYTPDYFDYMYSNCTIYDCGDVYLLSEVLRNKLGTYTFVIEKTK